MSEICFAKGDEWQNLNNLHLLHVRKKIATLDFLKTRYFACFTRQPDIILPQKYGFRSSICSGCVQLWTV